MLVNSSVQLLSLNSYDSHHDFCPALGDRRILQQLRMSKCPCSRALLFVLSTARWSFKFLWAAPLRDGSQTFVSYSNNSSEYSKYLLLYVILFIMPVIATKDETFAIQNVWKIRVHTELIFFGMKDKFGNYTWLGSRRNQKNGMQPIGPEQQPLVLLPSW